MVKRYRIEGGRPVEAPDGAGPIHVYVNPTDEEKRLLIGEFHLDEHTLASALDPDELPRMELEADHLAVIFKHPKRYSAADQLLFRIESLGLFLFKERLVIIAPEDASLFEGRAYAKIASLQTLFLRVISNSIQHFIGHLKVINDIANELEPKIIQSLENRYLLLMFTIEKSLVYYVNAIGANGRVIERLKANAKSSDTPGLSPDLLDYVDDLAIENAQCHEQAQVFASIFGGLMDARASIVGNNLNVLMKRLTVLSVVFMPLNVLAGVFGMSEFTMMTEGVWWPISYGVFLVGLTVLGLVTYYVLRYTERKSLSPAAGRDGLTGD